MPVCVYAYMPNAYVPMFQIYLPPTNAHYPTPNAYMPICLYACICLTPNAQYLGAYMSICLNA
jgi:hypothetical protein